MIKYSLIILLGINTMLGQSEDKIMHTVTCMGISAVTYTYLRNKKQPEFKSRFISFATTMAIGTLKEVVDDNAINNNFDWNDMGANALGALCFQLVISVPLD